MTSTERNSTKRWQKQGLQEGADSDGTIGGYQIYGGVVGSQGSTRVKGWGKGTWIRGRTKARTERGGSETEGEYRNTKPPSKLPRSRLQLRTTCQNNIQAPHKPCTMADQERLLRVSPPTELWREIISHAASQEHEFETYGVDGRNYTFEYSAS